jgi:hypothetical protein
VVKNILTTSSSDTIINSKLRQNGTITLSTGTGTSTITKPL